jgi:hypothetical protein
MCFCAQQLAIVLSELCRYVTAYINTFACFPFAAFALISDYVSNADAGVRAGAILGLGLAYAGTQREEVQELLVPLVSV